uniref:UAP56-interacting factor n=1 Tax=Podarcis muralis TaxID=64176 RepID=A0A670I8P8_PODMU
MELFPCVPIYPLQVSLLGSHRPLWQRFPYADFFLDMHTSLDLSAGVPSLVLTEACLLASVSLAHFLSPIYAISGFGKNRLGRRKRVAGKRPPYGVKTGLAARKALGSHKGISPLNRSPLSEKVCRDYSVLKRKTAIQRQSELQRKQGSILRRPTLLNRRTNIQSPSARIGNKLYQQKDARQATFLFKRGLKVQAQVHPEDDLSAQVTNRSRPWRTSTTNGGILTVSIDNPAPLKPRLTSTPVPPFLLKKDQSEEKKIPKGVPLQFDINSVGKQTNMTLNERFGILKEQRTALSQNKGSRFVTVG